LIAQEQHMHTLLLAVMTVFVAVGTPVLMVQRALKPIKVKK
jgi:hypothetical protein